jgi:HSP20 family molecular chaperone IbpA
VARAGKERMMAIQIDETTVRDRVDSPATPGYGETPFERRPWERVSQSREDRFPVTLWIGLKALVVAVAMPGVEPDDLSLSVRGRDLRLQGPAGTGTFSKNIDLPYDVEMPPILVKDGKDKLYILLQRK